ncbi:glyceraldehyde-3-phosphate dehydrogenase [Pelagibaculum spongiae]|uniref:Glyceraldehyde-3-phosphate dehydrogenase n=1 Tax=Pelagibaculum spongiae TaxID=2080658 RepID=A0A2V1GUJ0_9GAMM|nr:glyceraldehyde-3-phosphate dehydrogenase [Pelagibaculum spongiae]PVZ69746.1 glyceraldehyde-3-phosphate dehydrogenase [Pelagibaculum spongiae]
MSPEYDQKEACFSDWKQREEIAEQMLPVIGRLYRDNGVVINLFGRRLVNQSTIGILKAHRFVRQIAGRELSVKETFPIIQAMTKLNLASGRVDVARLAIAWQEQAEGDLFDFVKQQLEGLNTGRQNVLKQPQDVVLYGFGRIGRLLARMLVERSGGGDKMRLRAIVVRKTGAEDDLAKRASLLRRDSVHGSFQGTILIDEENSALICNGNFIKLIYADGPDKIDYTAHGIDNAIVVDNTGMWRDKEGLGLHLKSKGVSKVLLTAPGKGDIPNVVHGINHNELDSDEKIFSAASCTTNAIVPILKVLNDNYGIKNGHVETCHSYTNDQNLIDNYHKGSRRGRAAALNMVISETGAAKAVAKVLPQLAGKLTGNAIRVPTPNVSLAILNLNFDKATDRDSLNNELRQVALHSPLKEQIAYTNSPEVVSSDFVGFPAAGIVDSLATIVDGDRAVVYVWYDNEFGYSCQVIRVIQQMAGIEFPEYPLG